MKILLTHGYFLNEDPKELRIMKPYVPLGILYISAYLEQHGFANDVFDSTFSSFDNLLQQIQRTKPDVLAVYTNLMTKINVLRIIREVKNNPELSAMKIILGGPEVRHHASSFLDSGADFIVIGEGEETMLDLLKHTDRPELVAGLAFRDSDGKLIQTAGRQLIRDINTLPLPARHKIDFTKYLQAWKQHHGYSMMSVSTMRGCPYTCKWCSRAVYGGTYRRRSPEAVAAELRMLQETYKPDMIWFVDDVFTIHHRWLQEFAEQVKNQGVHTPYEIISRADRLNEDVLRMLKDSGCRRVWIGAESGSQKIIDAMDRRVDVIKTREMIRLAKTYGIEAGTFLMLGYPGETKEDIRETIRHLVESDPTFYTITIAYPIKGTRLYEEVENKFLYNPDWETSTDRDIDFERTYPRRFYEHALQWVNVETYRQTRNKNKLKDLYLRLKSWKCQLSMEFSKR
ncbi:MAG: B12-binding domain-containing radical SAM protein [Bacteroidetes bacterium]|nr:B12-binding domain-containing radical SAM protein [Bacteroidota bacterium]